MEKSINSLSQLLNDLEGKARARGFTDTQWAARAGIRNETLSRLRSRRSCDFATLQALAEAVGARVGVIEFPAIQAPEDRFTDALDRDYEERLLELCASGDLALERWSRMGGRFFMAGLAVMVASHPDFDRRSLLDLAEALHAGSSQVGAFALWLERSPVRPSRFLPMLSARIHSEA
jgi:hypothetical protein